MSKLAAAGLSSTVAGPAPAAPPTASASRASASARRTASSRSAARSVRGQAGRPERPPRGSGPLSPMRTARDRAFGRRPGRARQVDALVAAAGDEHDRRLEGAQRGDHRVGLGPLRVVDEADAVDRARRSRGGARRRVNAAAAARIASGSTPNSERRPRSPARAFETLCAPGIASSAIGMIRPSRRRSPPRRRPPAPGARRRRRRSSRRRRPSPPGDGRVAAVAGSARARPDGRRTPRRPGPRR